MDNNYADREFVLDSHGRKLGTAKNFFNYSGDAVFKLKSLLKLSISSFELSICRNYYKKNNFPDITFSELYLLDEIAGTAKRLNKNAVIKDLYAKDKNIIETYNDLVSKHVFLEDDTLTPLSIEKAASVSSEYMNKIGAEYKNAHVPNNLRTENGLSLFPTLSALKNAPKLQCETAFAILTPISDDIEYQRAIEELSETLVFTREVTSACIVDDFGIASALSDMADGIFADIFSLPNMPEHPELSDLSTALHGMLIVALSKHALAELSAEAESKGLKLSYFAKSVPGSMLTLHKQEHISMCIGTELIRSLSNIKYGYEFKPSIDGKKTEYLKNTLLLKIGELELTEVCYGNTLSSANRTFSPLSATFYASFFENGENAVIDAVLPMIAEGVPIEDISLSVNYNFPKYGMQSEVLSTILGIYRTLTELCVANKAAVSYESSDKISLSLLAHSNAHYIPSSFVTENNFVSFLSYNTNDDGMPDFESFRKMCRFFNKLLQNGEIISARAVSGNVWDTVLRMSGTYSFEADENAKSYLKSFERGIIIETSSPQNHALLLGKILHFVC